VSFRLADADSWQPPADVDVIVSNATLQWVPDHERLLARWAAALPVGGWLAFQVPGNFSAASHTLMRELAESARWQGSLEGVLRHEDAVAEPERYASVLADADLVPDVWETTYLHLLAGDDPVLEWVRGTGLRPVLQALDAGAAEEFTSEYAALLRQAYPPTPHGTAFAFRRIFAVGHRP
ncbi:MAG TPA: methyltransferase domain-containing protein, partial [Steroidobacteraceae bacterium]